MLKSVVIEEKKFKHSPWAGTDNPANRQRYYNVNIWLYEGLVEPNVAKTLLQCFVQVAETFCWNQPKTNVVKTLYC